MKVMVYRLESSHQIVTNIVILKNHELEYQSRVVMAKQIRFWRGLLACCPNTSDFKKACCSDEIRPLFIILGWQLQCGKRMIIGRRDSLALYACKLVLPPTVW